MNSTRSLRTPHLDRLAATGVVLLEYRVAPMCSPTRSATMTGRYITRLGTQGNTLAVNAPWGISLEETMLPQNLKDAGYATAMWGKVRHFRILIHLPLLDCSNYCADYRV